MGRRHAVRDEHGGGEVVTSPRTAVPALTLGLGSVAVAGGVAVWLAALASGDAEQPVRYLGLVGAVVVALAVATGLFAGVACGIVLLGAGYAVILVIDDPPLDARAAVLGAALLVVGELGSLSVGARGGIKGDAGSVAGRVAWVALVAFGATLLGGLVLAVVDLLRASGTLIEAVGVAAALAAVALLALAAQSARDDGR